MKKRGTVSEGKTSSPVAPPPVLLAIIALPPDRARWVDPHGEDPARFDWGDAAARDATPPTAYSITGV